MRGGGGVLLTLAETAAAQTLRGSRRRGSTGVLTRTLYEFRQVLPGCDLGGRKKNVGARRIRIA